MCLSLPDVAFLAMDARHCAGAEMQDMMAYAASAGGNAARREGAKGFVGNANDGTAHWFDAPHGYGTMPHSLIGYAGSTVRAGDTINVPSNAPHQFHNASSEPVRMICICSPAGNDEFFLEVGVPVATRTTPPPKLDGKQMAEFLAVSLDGCRDIGIERAFAGAGGRSCLPIRHCGRARSVLRCL